MLRCGTDIIRIERIRQAVERQGEGFLEYVYTTEERAHCKGRVDSLAGRFAAKEAVAKALGTGLLAQGVGLIDIEILTDENGAPRVVLHGAALSRFQWLGASELALSISHEGDYAVAMCVIAGAGEADIS